MQDKEGSPYCSANSICDALNFIGDASYAIFPKDVAHQIGEMKKNFLGGLRWLVDRNIEWVDARVEGGDRLREEWQRKSDTGPSTAEGI